MERACAEGEEFIIHMGGNIEKEGGRRMTRSSVKSTTTPATPPPPAKKARTSNSTPISRRGRPKKGEDLSEDEKTVSLINFVFVKFKCF